MNFSVDFIYKATHPEPYDVPFHTHNCHELVLYTQGEGIIETEEKHFKYKKNSLVIIPPDVSHNEINTQKSCNIVVGFHSDIDIVPFGIFQANSTIISILHNMLYEEAEHNKYSHEIIGLQLHRLILILLRLGLETSSKKDFSFILNNIDNYIEENLNFSISISDFAEMYNYSTDRFRHIFTEKIGIPPKQYIILKRLGRAKNLLETTDTSITTIAHDCGFYDISQFSKMFKHYYSVTPTQFRKKNHLL